MVLSDRCPNGTLSCCWYHKATASSGLWAGEIAKKRKLSTERDSGSGRVATGEEVATPSNHFPVVVGHMHLPVRTSPGVDAGSLAVPMMPWTGLNGHGKHEPAAWPWWGHESSGLGFLPSSPSLWWLQVHTFLSLRPNEVSLCLS